MRRGLFLLILCALVSISPGVSVDGPEPTPEPVGDSVSTGPTQIHGPAIPLPPVWMTRPRCDDAVEGRRPITKPIVIGPGQEGTYIVTRNIFASDQIIHVLTGTGAVDIDLNGFTLDSEFNPIQVDGARVFKVRNGNVTGSGISIKATGRAVVEDLTIAPAEGVGIGLTDVRKFAVRRNLIYQGEPAMSVRNAVGGVIEDNIMDGGDAAMILRELANVGVSRNRVDNPGDTDGIDVRGCSGCSFVDNMIHDVLSAGLSLDRVTGSRISGNVISGGERSFAGIQLKIESNYNLIFENTISDSGEAGILVAGTGNVIDRNLLNGNGSWGLHLTGSGNVYKGNVAMSNGGTVAGCPGTGPATKDLCDATSGGNLSPLDNLMPDPR